MQQQIPDLVAERVLAVRRRTYASNAEMQERRAQRGGGLSPEMRTILEAAGMSPDDFKIDNSGLTTKPLVLDKELQFWAMDDDGELEEFLSGDLMPALLDASPEQWRQLPAGYEPLTLVLEFERHNQFEGWYAVENRAEDMPGIINGYHFLGLGDEARALAVVARAHSAMASDDPEAIEDVLAKAYATVPNATPEFEDRMPIIFAFVRSHPELFHSARTMP